MLWSVCGCTGAEGSDVTERMIHTGGEQIQGNETRNFRDRGPRIGENWGGGGGGASWTAQALFPWTRTHVKPRRLGKCGYIAAGVLHGALMCLPRAADVSDPGIVRLRGSGLVLLAPWHRMATVTSLMPASVYSHVARKKISTLSLRSAVENGSFCWERFHSAWGFISLTHWWSPGESKESETFLNKNNLTAFLSFF